LGGFAEVRRGFGKPAGARLKLAELVPDRRIVRGADSQRLDDPECTFHVPASRQQLGEV
jgi:hypothetical protein